MTRRSGVFEALEDRLRVGMFENEQEAVTILSGQRDRREEVSGQERPKQMNLFDGNAQRTTEDSE
jgi:hypothetical protein